MALYAFKDADRMLKISAKEASDNEKRFYCPNPRCDAHLFLCSKDGLLKPYFRATLNDHPHIRGCFYQNSNYSDIENFDETSFDANNFFIDLAKSQISNRTSASGKTKKPDETLTIKNVKTILQLYKLCKSKDINDEFNGNKIWKMLLDERSIKIHTKGVFGNKIIEAGFHRFDSGLKRIFLNIPYGDFSFMLEFGDKNLFNAVLDKILPNRDQTVIVGGKWSGNDNKFKALITSEKQIRLI